MKARVVSLNPTEIYVIYVIKSPGYNEYIKVLRVCLCASLKETRELPF